MRALWGVVAVAWVLAAAAPAWANEPEPERVRVRLSDGRVVEGVVVSRGVHTLEVDLGLGFPFEVSSDQIVREVELEREGRMLHRLVGVDGRVDYGFLRLNDGEQVTLDLYQGGERVVPSIEVRELVELREPPAPDELSVAIQQGRAAKGTAGVEVAAAEPEPTAPEPEIIKEEPPPPPPPVVVKKAPPPPPPRPAVVKPKPKPAELAIRERQNRPPPPPKKPEEPIGPDPNRSRYLYAPSGFMLTEGEGTFSQKEVLFSTIAYGVTDNLTIEAGALTPAYLGGAYGLHAMFGVRLGVQVHPKVVIHGGAQLLAFPANFQGSVGVAHAGVTYGSVDGHVTFTLAKPFTFNPYPFSDIVVALSGSRRLSNRWAIVTENWLVTTPYSGPQVFDAVAFRWMWSKSVTLDVGAIIYNFGFSPIGLLPIPWVDLTVRWGGK